MNETSPREGSRPPSRRDDPAKDEIPTDPAPAESGSEDDDAMDHRFAADEEVADGGAAGADEARTPGMGA